MPEGLRLPNRLAELGLKPLDVDIVFCGHLHFVNAGGLCEMSHAEFDVHRKECQAANEPADDACFPHYFE